MKYRIAGADASTGKDIAVDVEAATERDALEEARRQGIFVGSVKQIGYAPPPKPAVRTTTSISGGKLFLIITGAVACGLTLALICYAVFFAAAGAAKPKILSANSNLGAEEQAFITTIRSGNADMVREYLVKPLNWKEVATPALEAVIVDHPPLLANFTGRGGSRVWTYPSNERQFWTDLSERLIQNGADVNTALHGTHDIDALRFLISHNANVNAPDVIGDTVLHDLASDDIWDEGVALLIESGANVNAVGYEGNTPLHSAAKDGAVKVINRLLSAGATINAKNKAGQTPLSIANLAMQKDAAALLKSRGGTE